MTQKNNYHVSTKDIWDWKLHKMQYWLLIMHLNFLGKTNQVIPRVLTLRNWEVKITKNIKSFYFLGLLQLDSSIYL